MTVVPMIKHTAAEETLFGIESQNDDVLGSLKASGLPRRCIESWHYTDLRTLLKAVPATTIDPEVGDVAMFTGCNLLEAGDAPAAASDFSDDDAIGKLNASFATKGVELSILGDASGSPFLIPAMVSNGTTHTRNAVEAGNGAQGTVIEHHAAVEGFSTTVTNLSVGDDADITYVISQQTDRASTHLGQINASIGENAKLTIFILNAGGQLIRQEVNVTVAGEGADFQLRGVNLIGDDQHIDVTMDLHHSVPNTKSEEILRNVVVGKGHGIFQGKIRVVQIAQKTDAKMACNTLLLSDDGNFSTKPELEIFADDVLCGHGATFADIEPSYMFYLMSRGIPEREARALLIKGFVDEIVEDINNEALESAMVDVIDSWLDANG